MLIRHNFINHFKYIGKLIDWYKTNINKIKISNKKRSYNCNYSLLNKMLFLRKKIINKIDSLNQLRKLSGNRIIKAAIRTLKACFNIVEAILLHRISAIPNILHKKVPLGRGPEDNIVLKTYKSPLFANKTEPNNIKLITGVFKGQVVMKKAALIELRLKDILLKASIKWGWELNSFPHLVDRASLYYSGQLPAFEANLYTIKENSWILIPTSEVAFVAYNSGLIAPGRMCAISQCYRNEKIPLGKKNKGMLRCNEFTKVENFAFTTKSSYCKDFNQILKQISCLLKLLKVQYRYLLLCSGDMSKTSAYTIDVEVWLPITQAYAEISSVSFCRDYQNRWKNLKYKEDQGELYTVNGSCLPVGRLLEILYEYYSESELYNKLEKINSLF